ncbi:MAG: class I SAM-dependent methyltransferase [Candidatus Daviesbacteria bacterium]|nr:class I SAM-dependent methyltransferase [Candidatus Daviesbacteria bacterium]
MNTKTKLENEIWRSDTYFLLAKKGSMDINHPGIKILQKLSYNARNILDLGCGEGTRLNLLLGKRTNGTGVDISPKALEMGKKSYPKIKFIKADLEKIPLRSESFDLVYSAYVFEHLTNPAKVLDEAIRLISPKGRLVLLSPNYGAPNRASPPFKGSRIKKLIEGIFNDFWNLFAVGNLVWRRVEPIVNKDRYEMDWDTTVEPYLGSFLSYIKSLNLKIEQYSSCWSEELPDARIYQKLFRILGESGIYPFNLWGPHLVVVAKKIL